MKICDTTRHIFDAFMGALSVYAIYGTRHAWDLLWFYFDDRDRHIETKSSRELESGDPVMLEGDGASH